MNHTTAPKTLPEALNVIRAMHTDLLAFRNPEFGLIASGRDGDFDDRVKAVLAHSAPVILADRHASDCASDVLYPAIEAAMKELQSLHPGFNRAVNRAFNHLHGAFWSECPAPASAATLRPENFQAPGPSMDGTATADSLIPASDSAIEREIQAKGKIAPRVTPADLQANIVHTEIVKHVSHSGQVLRWAVLTTRSGFAVTGNPSASVSPKNDIPEIGEKTAIENATQSLWPLMGYALKEKLAAEQTGAAKKRINICGVDCHRGDDECNGYCIGKAPHAKLIEA